MPPKIKLNNFPKAVLDRQLEIDGEQSSMREFLRVNLYQQGVEPISANEVREVIRLLPGESVHIGLIKIKRIS